MRILLFIILTLFVLDLTGQESDDINWVSWDEAMDISKAEDKKVFLDIVTKWCGWCKKMDRSTFSNPFIIEYINENYVAVRFDAEHRGELTYKGEVYNYKSVGSKGYHELAAKLTGGDLRYPTIAFLDEKQDIIQAIPGYQNSQNLEMIMSYILGNHYTSTPWHQFRITYDHRSDSRLVRQKN